MTQKKLFAVILAFSMIFTVFAGLLASAANVKTAEFLTNGGFETVKDTTPAVWKISGAKFGEQMKVVQDVVHSGKNALKMEAESGSMFISQSIGGLTAGAEYTLSAWVKAENPLSGGAVKFEFYTIDSEGKKTFVSDLSINLDAKSKDWQEVKNTFKMPDTVSSANILFRIWNGGLYYWDDLSFTGVAAPDADPVPSKSLKTPYGNGGNLAKNGDFEKMGNDGYPENWSAIGNKWTDNQYITLDKEEKHSGSHSIKISTAAGGAPWVRQVIPVEPNTEYQAIVWTRQKGLNKSLRDACFKLEYYSEPVISSSTGVGGDMNSEGLVSEEGRWTQMEQVFVTPPGARAVALYCRLVSNGTIWFDDLEVYQTSATPKLLIETDGVFYYPDRKTGMATATLPADYLALSSGKVDFKLKDGDKVLWEQNNTEFTDGEAFFEYEISLLSEKKKEYTVEAVLKDTDGNTLETRTTDIYCYDRPAVINEKGEYLSDGKVFVPTIAYHTKPEMYDDAEKLGINVCQISYGATAVYLQNKQLLLDILNDLQKRNMKGIVCLYVNNKAASHPDNIETTKAVVADMVNHPAVFGYAVIDEPFSSIPSPEYYLKEAYKIIRGIDDTHPVYVLDANDRIYGKVAKYCDIFVHDPYPSNSYEPAIHTQNMSDIARQATKPFAKPFFVVNQAFLYGEYFPTSDELRSMAYQSLLAGTKGFGYYTLGDMIKNEEVYQGISAFAKEEQPLAYDLFTYGDYPVFNEYMGNGYLYKSMIKGGDVYALVLNRDKTDKTAEVSLLSQNRQVSAAGGTITGLFGADGTNPKVSGDSMILTLRGRQAALYKISGAALDSTKLAQSRFEDITDYPWAKDQIDELFALGIANAKGDRSYEPATPITRADFAMYLMRTLDLDLRDMRIGENFADIDKDAYYAREIAVGKTLGILRGTGDNAFHPEAPISRQDMMVICARGMRYAQKLGGASSVSDLSAFSDNGSIADYAKTAIAAMVRAGIVAGNADGTVNPLGNTTRAEAAVIMSRILNK